MANYNQAYSDWLSNPNQFADPNESPELASLGQGSTSFDNFLSQKYSNDAAQITSDKAAHPGMSQDASGNWVPIQSTGGGFFNQLMGLAQPLALPAAVFGGGMLLNGALGAGGAAGAGSAAAGSGAGDIAAANAAMGGMADPMMGAVATGGSAAGSSGGLMSWLGNTFGGGGAAGTAGGAAGGASGGLGGVLNNLGGMLPGSSPGSTGGLFGSGGILGTGISGSTAAKSLADYLVGQSASKTMQNQANTLLNAGNALNQPQRAPYQAESLSMIQNPSQWMTSDPYATALTAQFKNNVIPAQVAKSGNAANVIDQAGSQYATSLGGQYNQMLNTLMGYGGFSQPANTATYAASPLMSNAAGASTTGLVQGIGNLFNTAQSTPTQPKSGATSNNIFQ